MVMFKQTASMKRLQALGRKKQGELNKTEQAYANYLADRKYKGEIEWFCFEGIKFRLADKTFFTPDFAVLRSDGVMEIVEIKGSKAIFMDDAKVKLKVSAELFPFVFKLAVPRAKKDGGGWLEEEV
jgi:hypothetical protein